MSIERAGGCRCWADLAGRRLSTVDRPPLSLWLVRGTAEAGASPKRVVRSVEPRQLLASRLAQYLIRYPVASGDGPALAAIAIQFHAGAQRVAQAQDFAEGIFPVINYSRPALPWFRPMTQAVIIGACDLLRQPYHTQRPEHQIYLLNYRNIPLRNCDAWALSSIHLTMRWAVKGGGRRLFG